MRILVVEDDRLAQKVARFHLEKLGYIVDIAATGAEALNLTMQHPYILIFMDLGLRDFTGFEITKKIREQQGRNNNTPIVALTAHDQSTVNDQCIAANMNAYLRKPIERDKAKEIIELYALKRVDE